MNTKPEPDAPSDDVHLIVAKDEEVVIEYHPEDWIAFALFWSLAFIGGAVVTRKKSHIAVELLSNLMKPGRLRSALLALVDFITLAFMALLAYFSVTIIVRMHTQTMTVFDLPMSIVYGGVGLGCFMMLARQIQVVWRNAREGWQRAPVVTDQIPVD